MFFEELRLIGSLIVGVWTLIGDCNVLLSSLDKNRPLTNTSTVLAFRNVIRGLGLIDLPLRNKLFTWSNGRSCPILERLD